MFDAADKRPRPSPCCPFPPPFLHPSSPTIVPRPPIHTRLVPFALLLLCLAASPSPPAIADPAGCPSTLSELHSAPIYPSAALCPPPIHPPTVATATLTRAPSTSEHARGASASYNHPPTSDSRRFSLRLPGASRFPLSPPPLAHLATDPASSQRVLPFRFSVRHARSNTTLDQSSSTGGAVGQPLHARERPPAASGAGAGDEAPQTQAPPHSVLASHKASVPPVAHSGPIREPSDSHISLPLTTGTDDRTRRRAKTTSSSRSIPTLRSLSASPLPPAEPTMHQTSSRLLRMTDDERPFTKDFKDLFSTLMVSLPLTPHRVRWAKIEHTFTSEEAVNNLGSLKFSQSNRMPDPKDSQRIVTTTTTTTFSMAKEMARSVCQKFLEARFIESVDGKNDFASKSAVWHLTPKGIHILYNFCQRNGIQQKHISDVFDSPRNTMHLVILERETDTDKLNHDQHTVEVIFRRFVGDSANLKNSTASSDSDSLSEYATGMVGVKMAKERVIGGKTYWNTFTGKAASDWLMDCCMMVDRRESFEIAMLFCDCNLIAPVDPSITRFQPLKNSIYYVTEKGQRTAGWLGSPKASVNGDVPSSGSRSRDVTSRDSNANKMTVIVHDPALRLLFREFLRETHCEENLSFYLDVRDFLAQYHAAKKSTQAPRVEAIRETLAQAYSLYNAFLAPGSPCELNIDHSLRTSLAGRMTRAIGDNEAMIASLDEVATLFDQAQNSVFKLMASDSVPKFLRQEKYGHVIRERNLETTVLDITSRINV